MGKTDGPEIEKVSIAIDSDRADSLAWMFHASACGGPQGPTSEDARKGGHNRDRSR